MRKIAACVAACALLLLSGCSVWEHVSLAQSNYDIAQALLADADYQLLFRSEWLDDGQVYQIVEGISPYLSTLTAETYRNGNVRLHLDIPQKDKQEQALEQARVLGKQVAQDQTTIRGKLHAIHDALVAMCVYEDDNAQSAGDRARSVIGVMADGRAVCSGYARTFCAMCDGAGLDAVYLSDDEMNHAWNAVRLYGETYYVDCTYDDPIPDRGSQVLGEYFLVQKDQLRETHTWNVGFYEQLLDDYYPEDFAYVQRMQDLNLAPGALRARDVQSVVTQQDARTLGQTLGVALDWSEGMTCGELYRAGYDALDDEVDGTRIIDRLISELVVPAVQARAMGF